MVEDSGNLFITRKSRQATIGEGHLRKGGGGRKVVVGNERLQMRAGQGEKSVVYEKLV
jgi:hypothetical protein